MDGRLGGLRFAASFEALGLRVSGFGFRGLSFDEMGSYAWKGLCKPQGEGCSAYGCRATGHIIRGCGFQGKKDHPGRTMNKQLMPLLGCIGTIWKFPQITVPKMGEIYIGPRIVIGT